MTSNLATQTTTADRIAQLQQEIDDLKKTYELLSLNLPAGVTVEGGGSFYESMRARLADQDSRAEAERVLSESRVELKTKESELKQLNAEQVRNDIKSAMVPRLAELHTAVEEVEAIAAQLDAACAKLAAMDAAILKEFVTLNSPGWSGLTLSTPIAQYRQKMIRVLHNGAGVCVKARY